MISQVRNRAATRFGGRFIRTQDTPAWANSPDCSEPGCERSGEYVADDDSGVFNTHYCYTHSRGRNNAMRCLCGPSGVLAFA